MPDFNVNIKIDPRNAKRNSKKVENSLKRVENRADSMRSSIARAFAFIGVAAGLVALKNLLDTYTNIQNRLVTVTKSTDELVAVTEELFRIANETRSSYEGTAEVYARVALAVKEMGITQKETLNFTQSLNQAVILSGASATEANNAMIQLSQGLASGALRGDELRSVLEQLPVVADVIAKGLGVTRGELRMMGAEGKITAKIVMDAFAEAREELEMRFAETVPTIGQSFVVLRNRLIEVIGAMDAATGVSRTFAAAIMHLADNMEALLRVVLALSIALSVHLAKRGIGAVITGMRVLTGVIAANPIGAVVVAIVAAVSLLISFSDQIKVSTDGLVSLRDIGVATFQVIKEKLVPFLMVLKEGFVNAINTVINVFGDLGITMADVLNATKIFVNRTIGFYVGLAQAAVVVFNKIREVIISVAAGDTFPIIKKTIEQVINFSILGLGWIKAVGAETLNSLGLIASDVATALGETFDFELAVPESVYKFGTEVKEAFLDGFERDFVGEFVGKLDPAFTEIGNRARALAEERIRLEQKAQAGRDAAQRELATGGGGTGGTKDRQAVKELLNDLERQAGLLKLTNQEREIQNSLIKIQNDLKKHSITLSESEQVFVEQRLRDIQSLQLQADLYESLNGSVSEFVTTQGALNALFDSGRISIEQYNIALRETQLGADLKGLKDELALGDLDMTQQFQEDLEYRQIILDQALGARLLSESEHLKLSLANNKAYNDAVLQNELTRRRMEFTAASQAFGAMAETSADFVGKQSKTYKALFALSKGFAIAESTVAIAQGVANAIKAGWPISIATVAGTLAQAAGLISQIKSVQFAGGFQTGGSFKVKGSGGADSETVAFKATPGEKVSIETPQQQRQRMGFQDTPEAPGITVVNVVDKDLVEDFMSSPDGENVYLNFISRNKESINASLQQ